MMPHRLAQSRISWYNVYAEQFLLKKPLSRKVFGASWWRESGMPSNIADDKHHFTDHLREVLDQAPFGAVAHREGELVYSNAAARSFLGVSEEAELPYPYVFDYVSDKDKKTVADIARRRLEGIETPDQYEVSLKRVDGNEFPALIRVRLVTLDSDRLHLVTLADISQQKAAEDRLRRHLEFERFVLGISTNFINITPSEIDEQIHSALKSLGELIEIDRAFIDLVDAREFRFGDTYLWCRPGVEDVTGVVMGHSLDAYSWAVAQLSEQDMVVVPDVSALPEEAAAERELFERQSILSTVVFPIYAQGDLVGVFGVETVRALREWPDDQLALLRMFGQIIGYALGRKWAEESRRRYEEQLQQSQKLESLGVMAGGVAHDFNNLLMGILGNASLAKQESAIQETDADADIRGYLDQIEVAATRAAELTNQMLLYAGRGSAERKPFDMNELVSEIRRLLDTAVSKKAILETKFDEHLPTVIGDAPQIRQVVMNLITNASDALGDESGAITICTGSTSLNARQIAELTYNDGMLPGTYIYVSVADTGRGMAPEVARRIFEPFFSTKFTGRGLGLASALGIIRSHDGGIFLDTSPGQGTEVRLYLPVNGDGGASAVETVGANEPPWASEGTILIADDEPTVRRVAEVITRRLGFSTISATNGHEAIDKFRECGGEVAAIVLDVTMPGLNGFEVLKQIRAENPHVPVVFVSGYSEEDIGAEIRGVPKAVFLQKPYRLVQLVDAFKKVLDQR